MGSARKLNDKNHPSGEESLDLHKLETTRMAFGEDIELDENGDITDAEATHALR